MRKSYYIAAFLLTLIASNLLTYKLTNDRQPVWGVLDTIECGSVWYFGGLAQYGFSDRITLQDTNGFVVHVFISYPMEPDEEITVMVDEIFNGNSEILVTNNSKLENQLISIISQAGQHGYGSLCPRRNELAQAMIKVIQNRSGTVEAELKTNSAEQDAAPNLFPAESRSD